MSVNKSVKERFMGDENNIDIGASRHLMPVSDLHHTHSTMLHWSLLHKIHS